MEDKKSQSKNVKHKRTLARNIATKEQIMPTLPDFCKQITL